MSDQISNAVGSVTPALGNAWNTISSDASSLYNALPSIGGGGSSASSNPSTTTLPSTSPAGAPVTTTSPTGVTSTNLPGGTTALPTDSSGMASTTASPNPSGATPAAKPNTTSGGPSNLTKFGTLASTIGNAVEMIQRYQLQQNLQNPNWVAAQIAKLRVPLSKSLKNEVGRGVQAQMQEAGLGQAPGLFRQALAEALAPYQQEQTQNAQSEYEQAIQASLGAYPVGGGLDDFGKLLAQMYGGQQ